MVGKLIREARSNLGLTYEELAEFCEMTPYHLQRIEEGKVVKPHVRTLKTLAGYLDLDFQQLMRICGYLKPDLPENTLAKLVRNARLRKGYTQEELAIMSGVSKETVSCIERGIRNNIYLKNLRNIAKCLEVDFNYVMEISEYLKPAQSEKTLADLLKNARLSKGYSRAEVAQICQISVSTVGNIETGKSKKLKPNIVWRLASCLELDNNELIASQNDLN